MVTCPYCDGISTIPIVSGFPTEGLFKAAERGLVELGGCVVMPDQPTRLCLDCERRWSESLTNSSLDLATAKRLSLFNAEVLLLVKLLGPIKARDIAPQLADNFMEEVTRRDVNSALYQMKNSGLVVVNENYEWSLQSRESTLYPG